MSDKDPLDLSGVEMKMPEENFLGETEPPRRSYFWTVFLSVIILILGAALFVLLWFNPLSFFSAEDEISGVPVESADDTSSTEMPDTTLVGDEEEPLPDSPIFNPEEFIATSSATSAQDTSTSTPSAATSTATSTLPESESESATTTATSTEE